MNRKHAFATLLAQLVLCLLSTIPAGGNQQVQQVQRTEMLSRSVSVEDLNAEYYTTTSMITVRAKLTNIAQHVIKGHVTIYILAEDGSELIAYEEPVKKGQPFGLGETVDFEVSTKVKELQKVSAISVDFTED